MEIGIFAKTFARPSFTATLDAVLASGLRVVQFNMACAGLPNMPDTIPLELAASIRRELAARDMQMTAVSGTFNVIHPDHQARAMITLASEAHVQGLLKVRDRPETIRDHAAKCEERGGGVHI